MSENKGWNFGKVGKQKQGVDGVVTLLGRERQKGVGREKGRVGQIQSVTRAKFNWCPLSVIRAEIRQTYAHELILTGILP